MSMQAPSSTVDPARIEFIKLMNESLSPATRVIIASIVSRHSTVVIVLDASALSSNLEVSRSQHHLALRPRNSTCRCDLTTQDRNISYLFHSRTCTMLRTLVAVAAAVHTARATVSIGGVIRSEGVPVSNAFQTITQWSPRSLASAPPADFQQRYPFLRYVELFTATGGCYVGYPGCSDDRDLFNDPAVGMASGVNASSLFLPLQQILAAGLKPHIVLANIPIALSAVPSIPVSGGFGFNVAPPADYKVYRQYIAEVAGQLVAQFGLAEVSTWRMTPFTEYNNAGWLNGSATTFINIYDASVCGLLDAMDSFSNIQIGVHACVQCGGPTDWDPLEFLQWVATGTISCTGGPVHLSWSGNSFYEHTVGEPGDLSWWGPQGLPPLQRAAQLGLNTTYYSVDEGRLLWGPEGTAYALTTRAVGSAYQGSWDALFAKTMIATAAPYGAQPFYSRWGVGAVGTVFLPASAQVDNVAVNVARLTYKLAGGLYVPNTNTSDGTDNPGSMVDAIISAGSDGTLRALLFHHYAQYNNSGVASVTADVTVCGAHSGPGPVAGGVLTRVDDGNANFWPAWRADAAAANVSRANGDYNAGWSEYSDAMPLSAGSHGLKVFNSNIPRYQAAAVMQTVGLGAAGSNSTAATVGADGCVRVSVVLPPHGVALVELPGCA